MTPGKIKYEMIIKEENMKLKNLLVLLVAVVFVFAVSCKEKAKEAAPEKAEVKAQEQAVEKAEAKEAEEKEGEEEKGEKEEKGEEAEKGEEQAIKKKVELPAAVERAVKDNVPGAEIDILTVEKEGGIALYDIEFKAGKGEIEIAEDGTVIDVATIISMTDLPKAAAEAIQKAAEGATIKQLEKSEVRAEIKIEGEKGTIVKLASPKYVYEAEIVKGGQTGEIQVDPDGKIVEALKWAAKSEKEMS
jgi:hypothetical protein